MNYGEYVPPILTVDSVIFQLVSDDLEVLLIERSQEPFKSWWALPGGYNAAGETTHQAMNRVMAQKTGLQTNDLTLIEQLYTFDTVARDPRGHAVSVTYMGLGRDLALHLTSDTQNPQFFSIKHLPKLAYDHQSIIDYAHDRLKSKLSYTNACFALLPPTFTMTQLQTAYEAVFGVPLDKRNFRKKFLSLEMTEETGDLQRDGAHRPARLYRFKQAELQALGRNFD